MKMTIKIDEELGRKFRAKVVEIKGNKKGALSEAIEEAIKLWLEKYGYMLTNVYQCFPKS